MKHPRILAAILASVLIPFVGVGQAMAESQSVVQELHVRAIVASHRDIIVDAGGNITKIISNTPEDVMPDVYYRDDIPANKRPLTPQIYSAYRQIVPDGTAKYGVLYERTVADVLSKPDYGLPTQSDPSDIAAVSPVKAQSAFSHLLNNYHPYL